MAELEDVVGASPIIPVVVAETADEAVGIARALVAGGVPVIELTLRTSTALESIARIAREVPDILLGAGTVTSPSQARNAVEAGARFLVSPGTTPALLDAMLAERVPVLPGAATVGEALTLRERGLSMLKFFPAEAAGGADYLRALVSPLPDLRFCPTGGIRADNARDYLALPTVPCVGGSWLTPRPLVRAGDWDAISRLAREASQLRR